ncbi:MAG: LysM peptidoglycan-binding domain-containing protein [Bacillota bacterium]|jgi:LysM repeat protein|nr:LysM peptidoglycan-binding domain-containing protein [Bacillota bacterium]
MRKETKLFCLYYEIKQGDTLYSISRRYNVAVDNIIMANPFINVYKLQIGDRICLPCVPNTDYAHFTTYLIEEGDSLGSVCSKMGINISDLMELNDIYSIDLMPGTTLSVPII